MSVKRYSPVLRTDTARGKGYQFAEMELDEVGQWVSIADYGVLKAENEEIHADYEALANEHTKLTERHKRLRASSFVTAVPVEEYEKLKAEVERLEPELEQRCRELNLSLAQQAIQLRQIGELKAEVERLRKAGDAVCESPYLLETDPSVFAWRAAKEGKPSV